jgi:hypothetical protein
MEVPSAGVRWPRRPHRVLALDMAGVLMCFNAKVEQVLGKRT